MISIRQQVRGFGPSLPAAIVMTSTLALMPALGDWLEYDRSRILDGEVWRFVTGHLAHITLEHYLWDVIAFIGASLVCLKLSPRVFRLALAGGFALIPAALWTLQPELAFYRGLSGVDSALFMAAAALLYRQAADRFERSLVLACCAGFIAKASYEFVTGSTVFLNAPEDFVAVPLAHVVGAVVGLLAATPFHQQKTLVRLEDNHRLDQGRESPDSLFHCR